MKTTLSMGRRVPLVLLLLVVAAGAFLQGNTGLASRTPGTPKIVCDAPTAEWGDLIKATLTNTCFRSRTPVTRC